MRRITVNEFVSTDGVIESPEKWTFQYFNDEIGAQIGSSFAASDAMLLGRMTYETFAASFAGQSGGQADVMNNTRKYVVSTTLKTADWSNSTLINKNIMDEIAKLKQQSGKDIAISGSAGLAQSLIQHGLVDVLDLLVYPVVLGAGKRLFPDGMAKSTLKLLEARQFNTGVVLLRYQPEKAA